MSTSRTAEALRYGNHPDRPAVEVGDLASYSTVRSGAVKVAVVAVRPIRGDFHGSMSYVRVRVTSRTHPAYRVGELWDVSPLHLSRRDGR